MCILNHLTFNINGNQNYDFFFFNFVSVFVKFPLNSSKNISGSQPDLTDLNSQLSDLQLLEKVYSS